MGNRAELWVLGFALCFFAGCGDATDDSLAGPGSFAGTYTGTSSSTVTITSPAPGSSTGSSAVSFSITGGSSGDLVVNGGDCAFNARRVSATQASATSGQICTARTSDGVMMTLTLSSGTLVLTGANLSVQLAWSGVFVANGRSATGSLTQSMTGVRR